MNTIYKSLLTFLFIFLFNVGNAQIVKFIKNSINVKYKVYITIIPEEASLFVFKVNKPELAISNGLWYIVENPMLFKNAVTLFKVNSIDEADLVVYYTNDRNKAGNKK